MNRFWIRSAPGRLAMALGALVCVQRAHSQTAWKTATDGNWTNGANWTVGVPNGNAANLTPTGADYTVTVDAPPANPFTDLTIQNGVGFTTTLDIDASGFTSDAGILTFDRGAVVNVNAGGEMRYSGYPATYPFVNIRNGAVWRIDGGAVAFTNLPAVVGSGRHYIYVGNASTGRLEIVSGSFELASAPAAGSTTPRLDIGAGANGRGYMEMQGGSCYINSNGQQGLIVGSGNRSIGDLVLTNNATLTVNNWISVGTSANCTGMVTVAGSSTMTLTSSRHKFGCALNGLGVLTVKDNGFFLENHQGVWLGGYGSVDQGNGMGILNVEGGTARINHLYPGYASHGQAADGEINVSFGWLDIIFNLHVGRSVQPDSPGRGVLNVSGGLVTIGGTIALGYSDTNAAGYQAYGALNMSSGTVTSRTDFIVGRGFNATGEVFQTGGDYSHVPTSPANPLKIGWNGGVGTYVMSNGTFNTRQNVYVGGGGYYATDSDFAATGTLHIAGGTFTLQRTDNLQEFDLFVGAYGKGTVTIGGGTLSTRHLNLESPDATLGFDFSNGGIGGCTVSGTLTIHEDAKLEIDATGAAANVKYTLVSCNARNGSFDIGNITVIGGDPAWVDQDTDQNLHFRIPAGTILMLR